jgi:hypothetical protein
MADKNRVIAIVCSVLLPERFGGVCHLAPSALLRDSPEPPPTSVASASDAFIGNKDTLAHKSVLVKCFFEKM